MRLKLQAREEETGRELLNHVEVCRQCFSSDEPSDLTLGLCRLGLALYEESKAIAGLVGPSCIACGHARHEGKACDPAPADAAEVPLRIWKGSKGCACVHTTGREGRIGDPRDRGPRLIDLLREKLAGKL